MTRYSHRRHYGLAALGWGVLWVLLARDGTASDEVSFARDIRPILADKCFQCHGPDAQALRADLRLDRFEGDGGTRGGSAVIVPGDVEASKLVLRITSDDESEQMPPPDEPRRLTTSESELLTRWVAQGGQYEAHWAFVAPERPPLPAVANRTWPRNGIDYFILERLEREGLATSRPATSNQLVRRVAFDLNGLPPELADVAAAGQSGFYERYIEELLGSPRYGEHWATMWLDAARYADTNGYNNDTPRYNWPYRDWVIAAFNHNMPYDQFVIEQLAGDLLPEATPWQQVASGFNRNHNVTSEGGIVDEEYRLEYVADRVDTTATVFMALTLRCARCHEHKFDPISQREYYQLSAFFNQVPESGYHKEHVGNPPPVISLPSETQSRELAELTAVKAGCEQQLAGRTAALTPEQQQADAEFIQLQERLKSLQEKLTAINAAVPTAMVMRDLAEPRQTFMLTRGAYDHPAAEVTPGVPSLFPPLPEAVPRNRLGFAKWLVAREHPLTARVIVNRVWAEIFGRGLVTTLEDFGTQGAAPSHPELLDWLAVELIDSGWDLQQIIRLIVTSATYRQSARMWGESVQVDPSNTLLARGPRFRLKAEVIRDTALAVSGLLVHQVGGPSVRPYQPAGLWVEVAVADDSYSGGPYVQSHGNDLYRRSVYTWWKRTCPPPTLNTLDAPEREFCRVERLRTNTPLQALVLLNDPTFVEAARKLAERMLVEGGGDATARLTFGFRLVTARPPTAAELGVLSDSLAICRSRFVADETAAVELLGVGESPLPQLEPAELAAYTAVANMLLNLDEFVTK